MRGRRLARLAASALVVVAAMLPSESARCADAAAIAPGPGRLVRLPDGRRMNFRCSGRGAPTVILEPGFAATSRAWVRVQPMAARHHRVCAYDRAGYGFSDPGPEPRDGAAIASDLDQGLRAARIRGPFILVGHSSGGLYVQVFAALRPAEVSGMVLVDPSVVRQDVRLSAVFGPGAGSLAPIRQRAERCLAAAEAHALPSTDSTLIACTPATRLGTPTPAAAEQLAAALRPSTWRTQISELDNLWTRTSDEVVAGPRDYGAMPIIVLTADGGGAQAPDRERAAALAYWRALHKEIAAKSSRGEETLVSGSSHMMMFDRPDAVAEAIETVTAASSPGDLNRRWSERR